MYSWFQLEHTKYMVSHERFDRRWENRELRTACVHCIMQNASTDDSLSNHRTVSYNTPGSITYRFILMGRDRYLSLFSVATTGSISLGPRARFEGK